MCDRVDFDRQIISRKGRQPILQVCGAVVGHGRQGGLNCVDAAHDVSGKEERKSQSDNEHHQQQAQDHHLAGAYRGLHGGVLSRRECLLLIEELLNRSFDRSECRQQLRCDGRVCVRGLPLVGERENADLGGPEGGHAVGDLFEGLLASVGHQGRLDEGEVGVDGRFVGLDVLLDRRLLRQVRLEKVLVHQSPDLVDLGVDDAHLSEGHHCLGVHRRRVGVGGGEVHEGDAADDHAEEQQDAGRPQQLDPYRQVDLPQGAHRGSSLMLVWLDWPLGHRPNRLRVGSRERAPNANPQF